MTERVKRFLDALRAADQATALHGCEPSAYIDDADAGFIIDGAWTVAQLDAALETALTGTDDDAARAMR